MFPTDPATNSCRERIERTGVKLPVARVDYSSAATSAAWYISPSGRIVGAYNNLAQSTDEFTASIREESLAKVTFNRYEPGESSSGTHLTLTYAARDRASRLYLSLATFHTETEPTLKLTVSRVRDGDDDIWRRELKGAYVSNLIDRVGLHHWEQRTQQGFAPVRYQALLAKHNLRPGAE